MGWTRYEGAATGAIDGNSLWGHEPCEGCADMGWTRSAGAASMALSGAPYGVTDRVRGVCMKMMVQTGEGGGRKARHRLSRTKTQHMMVGIKEHMREREREKNDLYIIYRDVFLNRGISREIPPPPPPSSRGPSSSYCILPPPPPAHSPAPRALPPPPPPPPAPVEARKGAVWCAILQQFKPAARLHACNSSGPKDRS